MKYREWAIKRFITTIPGMSWHYVHESYAGPEDERVGVAGTLQECIEEINKHDRVPYSNASLQANAELLLLTERLEMLEDERVKNTERVAWLNAKAWIEAKGITPESIWTEEEVQDVVGCGFSKSIYETFAWSILHSHDNRRFVQFISNMVYELASIREGSWIEMNVSIYQVEQYAKEFATKPDANPA